MINRLITGVSGSGKTTCAREAVTSDSIYLTHHVTANGTGQHMTVYKFLRTFSNMRCNDRRPKDLVCKDIKFNHIIIDEVEELTDFSLSCMSSLLVVSRKKFRFTLCIDTGHSEVVPRQLVELFSLCTTYPWRMSHSSYSYRIPQRVGDFVNLVINPPDRIDGMREEDASPVTLTSLDIDGNIGFLCDRINRYATEGSVLLISRSTANNSELTRVCNELTNNWGVKIRCASVHNDEDCGSVEFCSMAACRSFEADYVIVFGFLRGNEFKQGMYFALTRAKKALYIVHSNRFDPFYDLVAIEDNGFTVERLSSDARDVSDDRSSSWIPVSSLTPPTGVDWGKYAERWEQICASESTFHYSTRVRISGNVEDVSHIYGIMVPLIFEHERTGRCKGVDVILAGVNSNHFPQASLARLQELYHTPAKCLRTWAEISLHVACFKNFHYLIRNIRHFDWVDDEVIRRALNRMRLLVPGRGRFEEALLWEGMIGRVDFLAENGDLWEFKFTNELQKSHFYQTHTYGKMSSQCKKKDVRVYLFNIRTCELWSEKICCDCKD